MRDIALNSSELFTGTNLTLKIIIMKTQITISGQISGNFRLRSACMIMDCEEHKQPFNGFKLVFNTSKEARKALREAYKYLKAEEPDYYKDGGISLYNDSLSYDASIAKLSKLN